MNKINLKTWTTYFRSILTGIKTFEIRKDDRGYNIGDILILNEWNGDSYTGHTIKCIVTYIFRGKDIPSNFGFNMDDDVCVMSIKVLETYIQC